MEGLQVALSAACRDADRRGFDCPSEAALAHALSLLRQLASIPNLAPTLDVAVGEDGALEITAVPGRALVVIDIDQAGRQMELVVQALDSGAILEECASTSEDEVVRLVERAA
jgi:hypothetical protein